MGKTRAKRARAHGRGLTRRQRRRLLTAVGAIAASLIATAAGWLYAGVRPAPAERAASVDGAKGLRPIPPELRLGLGPDLAEPRVRDGVLELPVVDVAEMLPGCHK